MQCILQVFFLQKCSYNEIGEENKGNTGNLCEGEEPSLNRGGGLCHYLAGTYSSAIKKTL